MSDEQDMRKMGGIWRKIPLTYAVMWIGSLALAGIPPFAGYYSKDAIIEAAFAAGTRRRHVRLHLRQCCAAFLTAFYSWRLLFMTFHGTSRADHHVLEHVHESPWVMLGAAAGAGRRRAARRHGAARPASSAQDWQAVLERHRIFNAPDNHVLRAHGEVPGLGRAGAAGRRRWPASRWPT